jgi:hypothetical protein
MKIKFVFGVMAMLAMGTGCGGKSNADRARETCEKFNMCFADSGLTITCDQPASDAGPSDAGPTPTCTNQSAINTAVDNCNAGTCENYQSCMAAVPACQM